MIEPQRYRPEPAGGISASLSGPPDFFGGAAADRLGMRNTLLAVTGVDCALASDVHVLIVYRAIQGIGAGAATVVVPVLLRRRFTDADAMRAISWVSIAESIIQAVAPVIGAGILLVAVWRSNFWLVTLLALLLLPFIFALTSGRQVLHVPDETVSYAVLLRDATVYGLMFGALISFVASAPHLVGQWNGCGTGAFALLQVCGVSSFIVAAARTSAMAHRYGTGKLTHSGALMQLLAVAGLFRAAPDRGADRLLDAVLRGPWLARSRQRYARAVGAEIG